MMDQIEARKFTVNGTIVPKYAMNVEYGKGPTRKYISAGAGPESEDFKPVDESIKSADRVKLVLTKSADKNRSVICENKPVKLRLIGMAGSEFVQVLTPNNRISYMNQDVMFEAMSNYGIDKDGWFDCKFIVASINSRLMWIREGSRLHEACKEYTEIKNRPKMNKTKFNVGQIYSTATGNSVAVFLGYVTTKEIKWNRFKDNGVKISAWAGSDDSIKEAKYTVHDRKLSTLWLEVTSWQYRSWPNLTKQDKDNLQNSVDAIIKNPNLDSYGNVKLKHSTSHKFVQKAVEHTVDIPHNVIFLIANAARRKLKNDYNESLKPKNQPTDKAVHRGYRYNMYGDGHRYQEWRVIWKCDSAPKVAQFANMHLYGLKASLCDEVDAIIKYWPQMYLQECQTKVVADIPAGAKTL